MAAPPRTGRATASAASTIPTDLTLSVPTLTWLAAHPNAHEVVSSVWATLAALERTGQDPGALAALRFVLTHHQPPTRTGHCPTCRRSSWRHPWRRRPFPCLVWRQIRGELLGHLTPPATTTNGKSRHVRGGDASP